jgi:hypothetical protein
MKYKIDQNETGIDISVTDASNDRQKLMEAFRECQEGRCSCPTEEYKTGCTRGCAGWGRHTVAPEVQER